MSGQGAGTPAGEVQDVRGFSGRLATRLGAPRAWVIGLLIVIGLPLVVALFALHAHPWFPTLDVAVTEMQVRNVLGPDTPLVGLYSRIGSRT